MEDSKENVFELHDNTFSYKDHQINDNTEINRQHNYSYQENSDRYSELTLDMSIVNQHLNFLEVWSDLEISLDNKTLLNAICNKYLNDVENEILTKSLITDIFSASNLNRTYNKLLKIKLLLIFIVKMLIIEFANYDITSVRNQIKRIIMTFSEALAMFVELFIFQNLNSVTLSEHKILVERMNKLHKKTMKKKNEDLFHINKLIDSSLISTKTFVNTVFTMGLFTVVHNMCFELIRDIDKFSTQKLGYYMLNNLLYGILRKEEIAKPLKNNKLNNLLANKSLSNKVKKPFLPPNDNNSPYTLVLDLDETLVHFFYTPSGGTFFIRPGAMEFLKVLSEKYEIVIFTAGMKDYADNILDLIDPNSMLIKHRLYRHHTSLFGPAFVKDLSNIGRDLSKTMIIDNLPDNFALQQNNGLAIITWTDDINDTQLDDLMKILKDMYDAKVSDVREVVKKINEEATKNIRINVSAPYTNIEINNFIEGI